MTAKGQSVFVLRHLFGNPTDSDPHLLELLSSDTTITYRVTVDGNIERTETERAKAQDGDTIFREGSNTIIEGRSNADSFWEGDAYKITGPITHIEIEGDAEIIVTEPTQPEGDVDSGGDGESPNDEPTDDERPPKDVGPAENNGPSDADGPPDDTTPPTDDGTSENNEPLDDVQRPSDDDPSDDSPSPGEGGLPVDDEGSNGELLSGENSGGGPDTGSDTDPILGVISQGLTGPESGFTSATILGGIGAVAVFLDRKSSKDDPD